MTLKDQVYNVFEAAVPSVPFIFARQNAVRPAKPYGTLDVRLLTFPGFPVILPVDAEGNLVHSWSVQVDVEVNVYGSNAHERMMLLPMQFRTPVVSKALTQNGLSVRDFLTVADLTEVLGNRNETEQYEERAMAEIRLHATMQVKVEVGLIESAVVNGSTVDPNVDITQAFEPGVGPLGHWLSGLGQGSLISASSEG